MTVRFTALIGGLIGVAIVGVALPDTNAALVSYDVAIIITTIVIWYGASRPANDRLAWRLIAAGMTCWCIGDLAWDAYAYVEWERPSVSVADFLYLAGYPLLAAGIVRMVILRTPGRSREGLLDGAAFALAAAMTTWEFLVVPTTRDASVIDALVWGAYPLADVFLLAGVAWLVLSPGRRGAPTWLFLAFLASTLFLDLAWVAGPLALPDFDTALLNAGYPLTYGVLAITALLSNSAELTAASAPVSGRMHPGRFLLLGFALVTAPAITIANATNLSAGSQLFLFGASTVLAGIVLWRFRIAVREREAAQDELAHQLAHDQLTGLANRPQLVEQLKRALSRARRSQHQVAVLYVDLDSFKPVNDTWGHSAGDAVLVEVGHRLRVLVRPHDLVARVGGDEFAVVCESVNGVPDAERVAKRIVRDLSRVFAVYDEHATVSASVGVAISSEGSEAEQLLHDADAAMYHTKREGRNRHRVFNNNEAEGDATGAAGGPVAEQLLPAMP